MRAQMFCDAKNKGDEKLEQEARRELDNAVFMFLGLAEDNHSKSLECPINFL